MRSLFPALAAIAIGFWAGADLMADSFNAGFTGPGGVSGSFLLTGVNAGGGEFLITTGSGVFNDGSASGPATLIPNPAGPLSSSLSPSGDFAYDDLLFPGGGPDQFLTVNGLLFSFNGVELNVWQLGGGPGTDGWNESVSGSNGTPGGVGTFTATPNSAGAGAAAAPEPSSWKLGLCGALAIASMALGRGWRNRRGQPR